MSNDIGALADAIDPRLPRPQLIPLAEPHMAIPYSDLIAASDALRSSTTAFEIGRAMGRRCRLDACPVGLFLFEDTLCVMTEYATMVAAYPGHPQRDAYIVSSGEYFAGGCEGDVSKRGKLMVTLVNESIVLRSLGIGGKE